MENEKAEVEKKISDLTRPEEQMDNPDMDDIAQDASEDYLEESLLHVHKQVLEKINEALDRIQQGSYGVCLACGAEITEAELELEPWAEHCSKCNL